MAQRGESPASVDRHGVAGIAEQATSGTSKSRALRSQRAESTALMAIAAIPGRPAFRTASPILTHGSDGAIASAPPRSGRGSG